MVFQVVVRMFSPKWQHWPELAHYEFKVFYWSTQTQSWYVLLWYKSKITLSKTGLITESTVLVCSIYTAEMSVGKLDRIWSFSKNGTQIYYHGVSGWWRTESLVIREGEQCRLIMVPLSTNMAVTQADLHFSLRSCQELANIFFSLHPK